jgi:hypothetical protein
LNKFLVAMFYLHFIGFDNGMGGPSCEKPEGVMP